MKKIRLAALLTSMLIAFSCTKRSQNNEIIIDPVESFIEGQWEMIAADGSMHVDYERGKGPTATFTKDSNYVFVELNGTTTSGQYGLRYDTTASQTVGLVLPKNQFYIRLVLHDQPERKIFTERRGDTLFLIQGIFPSDSGVRYSYLPKSTNSN
ncbi:MULTISPECIES: hypothetical protein [Chitinophagaceae]